MRFYIRVIVAVASDMFETSEFAMKDERGDNYNVLMASALAGRGRVPSFLPAFYYTVYFVRRQYSFPPLRLFERLNSFDPSVIKCAR